MNAPIHKRCPNCGARVYRAGGRVVALDNQGCGSPLRSHEIEGEEVSS